MHKAYCDEAEAVFLCLMQKKKSQIRLNLRLLAEMVGFEPTCPVKDKTISSRSRYDHFDTSPYCSLYSIAKKSPSVNTFLPGAGPGLQRRPGLFGGIFCEVQRFLQKRAGFFAVFEYNIEDIVQI